MSEAIKNAEDLLKCMHIHLFLGIVVNPVENRFISLLHLEKTFPPGRNKHIMASNQILSSLTSVQHRLLKSQ